MSAIHFRKDKTSFSVSFDSCAREPLSWKEELGVAARDIANRADKPIWLCFSGGIDSEVMCQSFFDQGINFSVLTLRHAAGTNEHDIMYARTWCRKHDVHQKIVPIDMEAFLRSDIPAYIEQGYVSHYVFRYLQFRLMELVEEMGGFAVMAGGEQYYKVDANRETLSRKDVFLEFNDSHALPIEWCERNATTHDPYFMYSTPELCLSYLRVPVVEFALEHPDLLRHPISTFTLKRLAYQSVWTKIEARPKYHGFEKIEADTVALKKRLKEDFPAYSQEYKLPVVDFEAQLRANIVSGPIQ